MLCLVPMYKSCLLCPYQLKQAPTISVLRQYDVIYIKTVKNIKKINWKNGKSCFLTMKILGTSDFHRVCGKKFSNE